MSAILVVGASHAGIHAAASLREGGYAGSITVVGAEDHLPYHRPPLSKDYLLGVTERDGFALRPEAFYASREIELRRGVRVEKVDATSGTATTDTGDTLAFDRLVLATGARVRRLDVPGGGLDDVVHMRDLDDADRLKALLPGVRRAVVVGGGFIGLESAAVLARNGVTVTVVEAGDRLLGRAVSPELSAWSADLHRHHGVEVRTGCAVSALEGETTVRQAVLTDGGRLDTDLVVVGIGVEPRLELADQLGLAVDGGIIVDAQARTSAAGIVAAGDATVQPHPLGDGTMVRLESVQNATDQAAAAAWSLLGKAPRTQPVVPWFWSDQYDAKLQMAGAPSSHDRAVLRGSPADGSFTHLLYRRGVLVGAESVNAPADFVAVRRALATGASPDPDRVSDTSVKLKTLL
ncbi:FAD-dependent oxidoreductase [Nocardioides sp. AE5]|uniref:NAD(P)/FAD-dependent oxidoreductase n=1 Tax=Nocardioides sp. AE5 TaxID=2962573 RepID=UPI0028818991|nr:FAD-dependent oxidoreductase [Nocardioides sp. AE5]MDT0201693.1 FAD-dependent oxidoreductase [Nocardioides sp. AE5]